MDVFAQLAGTREALAAAEARARKVEDELEGLWGVYCDCQDNDCEACGAMRRLGLLPPTGQAEAYAENRALPDPQQERDAGAEG